MTTRLSTTCAAIFSLVLTLLFASGVAAAPVILNAGFESPAPAPFPTYGPIDDWSAAGGSGTNTTAGPFYDNGTHVEGDQVAFAQGSVRLEQLISGFDIGTEYVLRYHENARNCCGGSISVSVELDGTPIVESHPVTAVGGGGAGAGNPFNLIVSDPFEATAADHMVSFVTTASGDASAIYDAVDIFEAPTIIGDFNSDTLINGADFDILVSNFLTGTAYEEGDIDFDLDIDLTDFIKFKQAFNGFNGGGAPAGVPEPMSCLLLILGGGLIAPFRRRFQKR